MSAFYIFDNREILDPAALEAYKTAVAPITAAYGGRYRALSGNIEHSEGEWAPNFLVVIEFPSLEQAKAWYSSPEYAPLKALRRQAVRCDAALVAGLDDQSA
ncbi:MAG TPA: DUF1330 domain-containing protein [Microvirga sp.]|nr:DUF1330 domain-containing protein [Microvirga sp.]